MQTQQTQKLFVASFAALVAVAILHNTAEMYNLYERFYIPVIQTGWFDLFPHFLAGMSIGFGILWLVAQAGGVSITFKGSSARSTLFLAIIAVLVIGMAWELFEVALSISTNGQISDRWLLDTLKDLTMDISGAITSWVVAYRVQWVT